MMTWTWIMAVKPSSMALQDIVLGNSIGAAVGFRHSPIISKLSAWNDYGHTVEPEDGHCLRIFGPFGYLVKEIDSCVGVTSCGGKFVENNPLVDVELIPSVHFSQTQEGRQRRTFDQFADPRMYLCASLKVLDDTFDILALQWPFQGRHRDHTQSDFGC
jgi:hypothetical protein